MKKNRPPKPPPRHSPVALALMPFAPVERPSLALSLLQAALKKTRIPCAIHYANLDFASTTGLDVYRLPDLAPFTFLLGDWIFSPAAFPDFHPRDSSYFERITAIILERSMANPSRQDALRLKRVLRNMREMAREFTDQAAGRILAARPQLVGCSSSFQQHAASLALLRRIRELAPDVVTILGGPNCEGDMALAVARACPWVDVVFSGDADSAFPLLCRMALDHGRNITKLELPCGAITRAAAHARARETPAPRAIVSDPDEIPSPVFDDYFAAIKDVPFLDRIRPGLLMETSRGCWWGAKSKCIFCGIHPKDAQFRALPHKRAFNELARLSRRHGIRSFQLVDNILDLKYIDSLLPELAALPEPYQLFCETKASLSRSQMRMLAKAGFRWIQTGIEALHDDLLRQMRKGVTTLSNLQFLKYACEFGMRAVWNMLAGLPGEQDSWHAETAAWLPLIAHLEPPAALIPIMYKRYSLHVQKAGEFGLNLRASPVYNLVYPFRQADIDDLAYYFLPKSHLQPDAPYITERPGVSALVGALSAWRKARSASIPPVLAMTDEKKQISFYDTRPCAPERRPLLKSLHAAVYRACEPAATPEKIAQKTATFRASARRLDGIMAELGRRSLLLENRGRFLALAVPGDLPIPPPPWNFPGGHAPLPDVSSVLQTSAVGV